ncbi:type 1 glutamine amidotransferase domain-containing protein [Streptomyces cellulosae]|jgi:putative intracellular protease/amidase|uniref:Type 1 glutamine amidotransferase domain-containing protein n=3 Tax=Streptomyces TaxID=1883 RepID=A0ABU3J8A5_9ACTN|nr:type 1 glutamine amidotransferase domain-containing protein [Streptomyces sp. McG7]MBT2903108.1 type 1 glutamine amidotransferase domain-containing protein [Streptomyces sp. McG8]MCP8708415.1 type 1 glutamine amidotransferase domain-containing protein [Streptomyces sp. AC04842]MCX4480449.1 type 1 glutamine amidotransferase domain-containing protein [Streptomyces cellulosae]MDQ0487743.1 putative intracellular protease/amidase [Streptomyces thermodiastaticus]MDT6971285.1 type 1 glutamine amid
MADILMVLTGTDRLTTTDGTVHPTGYWAEEFTAPYRAFADAGHRVTVATPGGVVPTPDQASLRPDMNGGAEGAAAVKGVLDAAPELRRPLALADVDPSRYAAVFYAGGHGPMQDLAQDADSARLLRGVMDAGTPLGVVCHGVAALLPARTQDGGWLFTGYRLTAFSTVEEKQTGLADRLPWLLQERLEEAGADYSAAEPWTPHVVVDRNLYTGQNPASSAPLAEALLKTIG